MNDSTATHAYALPFGATCVDARHTRFHLWAPPAAAPPSNGKTARPSR